MIENRESITEFSCRPAGALADLVIECLAKTAVGSSAQASDIARVLARSRAAAEFVRCRPFCSGVPGMFRKAFSIYAAASAS